MLSLRCSTSWLARRSHSAATHTLPLATERHNSATTAFTVPDPNVSHVRGSTQIPLIEKPIYEYFKYQVSNYSSCELLRSVEQNRVLSWSEMLREVDDVASGLCRLGYRPGDRLAVWMHNNVEWVVLQLATAKLGVVLVCVNTAFKGAEIVHMLTSVKPKGIVVARRHKNKDYLELLASIIPSLKNTPRNSRKQVHCDNFSLSHIICVGSCDDMTFATSYGEIQNNGSYIPLDHQLQSTDPINIQFTSGTSGLPKPALLSHRNIINNAFFAGHRMRLTPLDKLCIPVPLFHCFGMVLGNLCALSHGASWVYPAASFDAVKTLQAVSTYKCTALHGVPTMFIDMLSEDLSKYDLSSLRTGIMAGSSCPTEIMRQAIQRMNLKELTICYGMTETSPVSWQTLPNASLQERVSTVGTIHPHVECKIVDENGDTVLVGEKGEIMTKGYNVMLEYYRKPIETREAISEDYWMRTGDIGMLTPNYNLIIQARKKDIIIRGGENIYPKEVEEFMLAHPRIRDVAVVAVDDSKYGEAVGAFIITKDGAEMTVDEVRAFMIDKIASYKIPVYVRTVAQFPKTESGKVKKFELREQMTLSVLEQKSMLSIMGEEIETTGAHRRYK